MARSRRIADEPKNIPRREAAFREGMLAEHLRETHGAAGRPAEEIDAHVAWLDDEIMRNIVLTAGK